MSDNVYIEFLLSLVLQRLLKACSSGYIGCIQILCYFRQGTVKHLQLLTSMGHLGTDPPCAQLNCFVCGIRISWGRRNNQSTNQSKLTQRATVRKSTWRNMGLMVTKQTIGKSSLSSSRPPFLPLLSLLPSFLSLFFLLLRCLLFRCSFCLISGVGSRCRGLNPQPVCAKHLSNQ